MKNTQASEEITALDLSGWRISANYSQPDGQTGNFYGTRDKAGNLVQAWEQANTPAWTYTFFGYDGANQLLSESRVDVPGYANTYTYDGAGNRLTRNSLGVRTTYSYGSGNRLLSEQTGTVVTSYSYDQSGNQTLINANGALTTYSWNTDNRLVGVQNPDGSGESLSYGSDGLRRQKVATPAVGSPVTTNFVYDGQTLVQERNESGLILAQYAWGPEQWNINAGRGWQGGNFGNTLLLQQRASTPGNLAGGVSSYAGADPAANIRILSDKDGNVTDRFTWQAFGEQFVHSGSTSTPFGFGGWVGYYQDTVRRLNVGWRVYDPVVGRWTNVDPIGFGGGDWNLYSYVGNNPVSVIDPFGLWKWRWPDFFSVNVNVSIPTPVTGTLIGWSGTANIDRYGRTYWSPLGIGIGKSATIVSGSCTANWVDQMSQPTPKLLNGMLTAHGFNGTSGLWGGLSQRYTPGSGSATGIGFVSPQAGVSYNYSWLGPLTKLRW